MSPESQISKGMSIDAALARFREGVNQPGTIFSRDHWLAPKLDKLRSLLTDPITEEEALALLDVLHQRRSMKDLIEWLETRAVSWAEFLDWRANREKEDVRKRADERERRHAEGRDPYFDDDALELFPDLPRLNLSDTCPDCGSSDWKPIMYGRPTEDAKEDARRGHIVLGGCMPNDPARFCVACLNSWPTKPNGSQPVRKPERVEQYMAEVRSDYDRLCRPAAGSQRAPHRARLGTYRRKHQLSCDGCRAEDSCQENAALRSPGRGPCLRG
ncbi:MAG: hypothetical protein JO307_34020 [Bryobacterales bacterium]|nr:hypothetical protein [Bryobacterales bacterium]MBV9399634.1 hypothetical protein [Bryobacterales bacterium]